MAGCQANEDDRDDNDAEDERVSPFTGRQVTEDGPVLAVKIDNAPQARPHTGLDAADIVYVEPVEAGLSRLVAVYSTQLPELVGPVRSARESDLELLRQFDEPALAYSGVQSRLQPLIDDAELFPEPPEAAPDAYRRDESRAAPHNLYVRPETLLDAAPEASRADDIGFTFGPAPESGGEPTADYNVTYPSAAFSFSWSPDQERWAVAMDGAPTDLGAPTVVVQKVTVRQSEYHDSRGNFTPYTETVGSGEAVVLRDGQAFPAEWERDHEREGTEFTTPDGEPMNFAPGPVWVVFEPA
ncbi:DUF3048 domain-containing protein [Streptomyces litchfieldiae]